MVFSSSIFLFLFLPIILLLYFLIRKDCRNILLLLASIVFYAWGEPRIVLVMLASILINYLCGLWINFANRNYRPKARILILILTIVLDLAPLFYFKYLDFFMANVNGLFNLSIPLANIALPIGISFFTFQGMSYVFDLYLGNVKVQKNPLNIALYIALFPQLVAGPIVRYSTIAEQIINRKETLEDFSSGIVRFIYGLGKKVILANSFAIIADKAFNNIQFPTLSVGMAWLGMVCYTFQIFFDFSGYSDMAIGLGKMFGFHFDENFNYPYISKSISEFWRRWHISLGTWFRDYVYFPLGGSRVETKRRLIFNLFVVWTLTGVWHGASWNFVIWGLMYFVLLTFEKLTGIPDRFNSKWQRGLYRIFTLLCIMFGWVIFRSVGLHNGLNYILSMFSLKGNPLLNNETVFLFKDNLVLLLLGVVFSMPIIKKIKDLFDKNKRLSMIKGIFKVIFVSILFVLCISYCINGSYNPFIYFNF